MARSSFHVTSTAKASCHHTLQGSRTCHLWEKALIVEGRSSNYIWRFFEPSNTAGTGVKQDGEGGVGGVGNTLRMCWAFIANKLQRCSRKAGCYPLRERQSMDHQSASKCWRGNALSTLIWSYNLQSWRNKEKILQFLPISLLGVWCARENSTQRDTPSMNDKDRRGH